MTIDADQVFKPEQFEPTPLRAPRRKWFVPWLQLATLIVVLVAAVVLWFLFTAKSVRFESNVTDFSATVSGGLVFRSGETFLMRPGSYEVEAESNGYYELQLSIEVGNKGDQSFPLEFKKLPGLIQFSSSPIGAQVSMEGEILGATPVQVPIPAGSAMFNFSAPRYIDREIEVLVEGMSIEQPVHLDLAPNWATVEIPTTPDNANVYIDGVDSGFTTSKPVEILDGERTITLKKPGFAEWTDILFVQAGERRTLDPIVLEPLEGVLSIQSDPAGATVNIDEQFQGLTPITVEIEPNQEHKVEVLLVGYERGFKSVVVPSGQIRNLNFDLEEATGSLTVTTEPENVEVWVDGKQIGSSNDSFVLHAVRHSVELKKEGYAGYANDLVIQPGMKQTLRVRLLTLEEARLEVLRQVRNTIDGQEIQLFEPTPIQMGASRRQPGRRANEVFRTARLERLFYISKHEVTNAQFREFATEHDSGDYQGMSLDKDDQPVVNVSWNEAALYCNSLSEREGLDSFYKVEGAKVVGINENALGYRLPTEAEWSWVARHVEGDEKLLHFPWGESLPPPDRHGNYADRAAQHIVSRILYDFNDNHTVTAPVGTFEPNSKGLFDIGGNVAEWTHDFYAIPESQSTVSVLGPSDGEYHVIRGSSYLHGTITDVRLSFRDYGTDGRYDVGFRVARYAE
ncbi:MAG: PEGA domain-containing protein [Gammaproteobacteria bacterium]|nr:PEGA domain-containing protein [Gammaproteobacteria bacterium]